MNFYILILILFFQSLFFLSSESLPEINADFQLYTNEDKTFDDVYEIKSSIESVFKVNRAADILAEIELDKYEVDIDEISLRIKTNNGIKYKIGKFKNKLTLEDYQGSFDNLFSRRSLVNREIRYQGYSSKSTGFKIYNNYKNEGSPFSWWGHIQYVPSQLEMQLNSGFINHFNSKESYSGFTFCYFPFASHESWDWEGSYTNYHNLFIDFFLSDLSSKFKYGMEISSGSNLISPFGKINYEPDNNFPLFGGIDIYGGFENCFSYFTWTPLLRTTLLVPEFSEIKCNEIDFVFGNILKFGKKIKINIDPGIGIITRYDQYDDDSLKTVLEWRWSFSLMAES